MQESQHVQTAHASRGRLPAPLPAGPVGSPRAAGKLPSISLPDGEVRFDEAEILKLLATPVQRGTQLRRPAAVEAQRGQSIETQEPRSD